MNDLMLFASNDDGLEEMLQMVKKFSNDSGMKLNHNKCAKILFEKKKLSFTTNIKLDEVTIMRVLEREGYNYLGTNEANVI